MFEAAQEVVARRREQCRIHAACGQHHPVTVGGERGGEFHSMIGESDDEHVFGIGALGKRVDQHPVALDADVGRAPVGKGSAVGDEHARSPI